MTAPTLVVPRICVLNDGGPVSDGLAGAAAAGFDAVLAAGRLADSGALPGLSAAAQRLGLTLIADIQLGRVSVCEAEGAPASLFNLLPEPILDPRHPPVRAGDAVPALSGAADASAFADWLAPRVHALAAAGAAGVRLLGLDRLPGEVVPALLGHLRPLCPGTILFAWTPGLSWDVLARIQPGSVDLVASSLEAWDGQADWLWQELALLRRIAPVVVPAGAHPALAAVLADGWMAPLGHDQQAAALNALRGSAGFGSGPARILSPPGGPVAAVLRTDTPDPRQATHGTLLLAAGSPVAGGQEAMFSASSIVQDMGAVFGVMARVLPEGGSALHAGTVLTLRPHEVLVFQGSAVPAPARHPVAPASATAGARKPRLAIEAPEPCVDGGRFPARRTVGTLVEVQADIIGDGHDKLAVTLRWQAPGSDAWHEAPMALVNNDRWTASFPLECLGVHRYEVHAWRDAFTTYADELVKKHRAGVPVALELREGAALVAIAAARKTPAATGLAALKARLAAADADGQRELLLSPETAALMAAADDRPHLVTLGPVPVQAERTAAGFASWYEVFPRSMSDDPSRHGTFADVERQLPRIEAMGFDVLYFPPIHPIGRKNRKGRNNTLTPAPDDPGSPYAIGSAEGGHDAFHPELGTAEDFQHLRAACARHGLELAMDFAIQCSPDHPWLQQHKRWFTWRPDGSIRYAENPPKRYEDIVNVDFYSEDAVPGLWLELCNVVLYWASQGVRLFRVDNPHTKPLPFWEWMIAEVQAQYPDAVFLAEAFTRPKVMYRLAKCGFSQSYTYFTWREQKWEFEQYLTELTAGPPRDFFRPHFFVNTPDINPVYLQGATRGAYLVRAALAATLSGLWGVYSGFELCEGTPVPGKEEYLDSEKYQIRAWDWDRPGNIVAEIAQLNALRRRNPALHTHLGLTFLPASGDRVLFFQKATPDGANTVLVAISLDAAATQYADLSMPGNDAVDMLTGQPVHWADRNQRVALPPDRPYAIWRLRTGL